MSGIDMLKEYKKHALDFLESFDAELEDRTVKAMEAQKEECTTFAAEVMEEATALHEEFSGLKDRLDALRDKIKKAHKEDKDKSILKGKLKKYLMCLPKFKLEKLEKRFKKDQDLCDAAIERAGASVKRIKEDYKKMIKKTEEQFMEMEEARQEYLFAKPENCGWTKVVGRDIDGEGDVKQIKEWAKSHSLADLKAMVVEKGWSGVTLGNDGTAYFKDVSYRLTKDKTRESRHVSCIHIYDDNEEPEKLDGGKWHFVKGMDIANQGDVEQFPQWKAKASIDDLQRIVEQKGYSGFTLSNDGTCYFKKVDYKLTKKHTQKNIHVQGIWIFDWPMPEELAETNDGWTMVRSYDIAGEGDVKQITDWRDHHSLDDLKAMVIDNDWSGFTLGKKGTHVGNTVFFKKVDYSLVPNKTRINAQWVDGIYLRPIGGKWEFFEGYDTPERGDCGEVENWADETDLDALKAQAVENKYSAFTLNKNGNAYFKKFPKQLYQGDLDHDPDNSEGMWVYTPEPPHEVAETEDDWTSVALYDLEGEGDVHNIQGWEDEHSLDDLKNMVIENGWSGFALGMAGTDAEGGCWFKKVGYKLTPSRLRVNLFVDKFHIYNKAKR